MSMLVLSSYGQAAPLNTIDSLSVTVQLEEGKGQLSPLVNKRMQSSVYTIADNILAGHLIGDVQTKKIEYQALIQDVFDRILLGYTVKNVHIIVDQETKVVVTIIPWHDVIKKVEIEIETDQMSERIHQLILQDIDGVEQIFEQILVGLPMDAVEWTNGIIKNSLQEFLVVHLPEFRGDFEIVAGEHTKVKLLLYPRGNLIRDIDLSLHSESIPNLAFIRYRPSLQEKTDILLGVPVDFIDRHKQYFCNQFIVELSQNKTLVGLGVKTAMNMEVGTKTKININANTQKYQFSIEGYLDIAKQDDNTSARIHLGKFISPNDEIFLETDFFPHKIKWVFMPGIGRKITPKLTVGYKYDLDQRRSILWAKQKLGDRFLLRIENIPTEKFNEFALRYYLHDFVGIEYVINDDDSWVRLVGNF